MSGQLFVRYGSHWNTMIQEIDKGQPCNKCKTKCSGFRPHEWKIVCKICKCSRYSHDIHEKEFVHALNRIGLKSQNHPSMIAFKRKSLRAGYSWIPPGLASEKIGTYFSRIPKNKIPKLGTVGEKYRMKQLIFQLPKQDMSVFFCKFIDKRFEKHFDEFVNNRNKTCLYMGRVVTIKEKTKCYRCHGDIILEDVAIVASRLEEKIFLHPSCFICFTCNELLVDLIYCFKDDKLFCERHYAEEIKPRCAACDEIIFSGEYIKTNSKTWHKDHYCCWHCDRLLFDHRSMVKDNNPYCIRCYEEIFQKICEECEKVIVDNTDDIFCMDKHWHRQCFKCNKCDTTLFNKQFFLKYEKNYCESCFAIEFAVKCCKCGIEIGAGTNKAICKVKQWHNDNFRGIECNNHQTIKNIRENELYCVICIVEMFVNGKDNCTEITNDKIITCNGKSNANNI